MSACAILLLSPQTRLVWDVLKAAFRRVWEEVGIKLSGSWEGVIDKVDSANCGCSEVMWIRPVSRFLVALFVTVGQCQQVHALACTSCMHVSGNLSWMRGMAAEFIDKMHVRMSLTGRRICRPNSHKVGV
jgi:hypothetical protein